MDDEKPKLLIVSSQTDRAIAVREFQFEVERLTRIFAANLLRVMGGAGKPHYLFDQITSLVAAIDQGPEGTLIGEINDAIVRGLGEEPYDFDASDRTHAFDEIEKGAMRRRASHIMGQRTLQTAGEYLIQDGIKSLDEAQQESRRRWLEKHPPVLPPSPVARKVRKPRAVAKPLASLTVKLAAEASEPAPAPAAVDSLEPLTTSEFMRRRAKALKDSQ